MTHRTILPSALMTAAMLLASVATLGAVQAYPATNETGTASSPFASGSDDEWTKDHDYMGGYHNATDMKMGMVSSIQNNEAGEPAWVVSGHWMIRLANETGESNPTGSEYTNITDFNAMVNMVMLNGNAMHTHEISNFTQLEDSTFDSSTNSTTIIGTATITMREGPVNDVPITITVLQNSVLEISPDPASIDNHFGNTPIYGIVMTPEMHQQFAKSMKGMSGQGHEYGDMRGGNSTDTAMADEMWK